MKSNSNMSSKSFSSATSNPFNGSRSSRSPHGFWAKLYLASTLGAVLTYTIDLILGESICGFFSNLIQQKIWISLMLHCNLQIYFFFPFKVSALSFKWSIHILTRVFAQTACTTTDNDENFKSELNIFWQQLTNWLEWLTMIHDTVPYHIDT